MDGRLDASRPRGAFTLIELLIVVAIIAILAAIAVPNFMEAQTRAKVARVKSDMRSMATALEAYAVDYNVYPRGDWDRMGLDRVTTPVAYITTLHADPFPIMDKSPDAVHLYYPIYFYRGGQPVPSEGNGKLLRDLFINQLKIPPGAGFAPYNGREHVAKWAFRSVGPDLLGSWRYPYDPTNGTVSYGDLCLFGPGNLGLGY